MGASSVHLCIPRDDSETNGRRFRRSDPSDGSMSGERAEYREGCLERGAVVGPQTDHPRIGNLGGGPTAAFVEASAAQLIGSPSVWRSGRRGLKADIPLKVQLGGLRVSFSVLWVI